MAERETTRDEAATPPVATPNAGGTETTVSPRRAARRARWAEIVFGVALCLYAVLAALAHRNAYFAWDLRLAGFIQSIDLPGFRELMVWVSLLGNRWMPLIMVTATGLALIAARFRIEGIVCMVGVGLGSWANHLFKALIARPRPDRELVQVLFEFRFDSFPSGHVVLFVEFFGFLLFLSYALLRPGALRRAALVVLGLLVSMIGVSRVYVGAHWPSDVVGAYLAGGIWLMLMIEIYRQLKLRQQRAAEAKAA